MRTRLTVPVLSLGLLLSATVAKASTLSYTCDASVGATFCATVNSTVDSLYTGEFNNVNASIYFTFDPAVGLGQSSQFNNLVSYATYLAALQAHSTDPAVLSLSASEPAIYNGGNVNITAALATALGITKDVNGDPILGIESDGATSCVIGVSGCFDAIMSLKTPSAVVLQYGQSYYYGVGPQDLDAYNIFNIIEHETDEVLGTSSCVSTQDPSGQLVDGCGRSNVSAVDLYRYQSAGVPVFISTTPGAYFSPNGGTTQVGGAYNTIANGNDYADFATNCQYIQDGTGCPGGTLKLGAEYSILNAVGYNETPAVSPSATPEPGSLALLGTGIAGIAGIVRRRRRTVQVHTTLLTPQL